MKHSLFSQVALAQDLPEYNLKEGAIGTVVEHYPIQDGEDGYSLEGFDVPHVTIEVPESSIVAVSQSEQEALLVFKLRQLSASRLLQIEEYVDFLVQKETAEQSVQVS